MNSSPAIGITDVCFGYETQEVLHNVSLTVAERDFVAFVGPNGGGKTTLLKLILGLLKPRHGTVRVFGDAPEDVHARMGYVPQHLVYDLRFPATVFDVVLMGRVGRHFLGPYRRRDREAASDAIEKVRLSGFGKRPFSELSGGERQRVLIAQALASEPDILLLDEPTANVDSLVEHTIYELLRDLHQHLTVILVSHNLNVVTSYVSHVACVNRTVDVHSVSEVTAKTIQAAYGTDLAILDHGTSCQVISPFASLQTPHKGARTGGKKPS